VLVLQATGSGAGQVLEPGDGRSADVRRSSRAEPLDRVVRAGGGEAAGGAERSCWRSGAELPAERSGAAGGAERSAVFGLRVFRGMRVAIDYKLSVSSVSACTTPNRAVGMLAGTETHSGQKLTLSKGRTVGCAEGLVMPERSRR
jgi:hypothetical protein